MRNFDGKEVLKVEPEGLEYLANQAMRDVSFLLRSKQLEKWAGILDDPESSPNDRGVAVALLQNAEVSAKFSLPLCQDTGTATIIGKKGQQIWTGAKMRNISPRVFIRLIPKRTCAIRRRSL